MFLRKTTIFLFVVLSFNLQAAIKRKSNNTNEPSKHDLKAARYFASVIKKITSGNYKVSEIISLEKWDKNNIFTEYKTQLNQLKEIAKVKNFAEIEEVCKGSLNQQKRDDFHDYLNNKIATLCHNKLLSYLENNNVIMGKDNVKNYLLKNLAYITKNHSSKFSKILEAYKQRAPQEFYSFSDEIYKELIYKKTKPPFHSLSSLPPNDHFTLFLQQKGIGENRKTKIYTNELASIYRNISDNTKSPRLVNLYLNDYTRFLVTNSKYINFERAIRHAEVLTRKLSAKGYLNQVNQLLTTFLKIVPPQSEIENEIYFNMILSHLINDDINDAYSVITKMDLVEKYNGLSSKLKFWIAYVVKSKGYNDRAKDLYQRFVEDNDINYYSILARKELAIIDEATSKPELKERALSSDLKLNKEQGKNLKRIITWLKLNHQFFADHELKQLSNSIPKEYKTRSLFKLVEIFNQQGEYLFTFRALYNALNNNQITYSGSTVKNLFPLAFFKQINELSKEIDPIFVISLIRQESAFNPQARSHVGASGLMQLMPATARQFDRKLKTTSLKEPKVNIKLGIKYLSRLLERYEGNIIHTLSAYNAGEGRVKRWKRVYFKSSDPLVNVEAIPFEETQKYVKLIYRNIYFYKYIMNKELKVSSLKDTFYVAANQTLNLK